MVTVADYNKSTIILIKVNEIVVVEGCAFFKLRFEYLPDFSKMNIGCNSSGHSCSPDDLIL